MFCQKCGNQIADTAKFCSKCGSQLKCIEKNVVHNNTSPTTQSSVQIDSTALGKFSFGIIAALAWFANIFITFFAPLIKNTRREEGYSLINWFFDTETIGSCISSCVDGEFSMSYQILTYFYTFILISTLIISISLIATKGELTTCSKISAACCMATSLLSLLMLDDYDSKKYKVTGWFFAICLLYIVVYIFTDFSKNVQPASESVSSSILLCAYSKHISVDIPYSCDIPTIDDFEDLLSKSELKEHLLKTHPNNQLYIMVHQFIFSKFDEMVKSGYKSNQRKATYKDSKNVIDVTLKYENGIFKCDILINM